jgi:RHS repeat-associated protein
LLAEEVALEPSGFTGKEADDGVGLVYFGERYLIPQLGHWASPDPAQIHRERGGEALNNYHYISGNLLEAKDPIGLDKFKVSKNFKVEKIPLYEGSKAGGLTFFRAEFTMGTEKFFAVKVVGLRGETNIEFAKVGVNAAVYEGSVGREGFALKGTIISGDIKTCVCGIEGKLECGLMLSFKLKWGEKLEVGIGPCELSFSTCTSSKTSAPNRRAQLLTGMMSLVEARDRMQEKIDNNFKDAVYWGDRKYKLQNKQFELEHALENVKEDGFDDPAYSLTIMEYKATSDELTGAINKAESLRGEYRKLRDQADDLDAEIGKQTSAIEEELKKEAGK